MSERRERTTVAVRRVRFDDLDGLRAMITEEHGPWGPSLRITQEIIDEFADLTGDHQWIHVDPERAADGPFGTTIAHGLLTLAIAPRIRPPMAFEVVGQGSTVNYGSDGLRFLEPVRRDDLIHARARLAAVEPHPRGTRLTLDVAVHVVDRDRPSMAFRTVLLHAAP